MTFSKTDRPAQKQPRRAMYGEPLVRAEVNPNIESIRSKHPLACIPPTPSNRVVAVCHPVWQLRSGGLERQLMQVVNRLRDGFRHVVVVRGWDDSAEPMSRQLAEHVQLIRQSGPKSDPNWSRRLASILREFEIDVLHARGLSMLVDCLMAAETSGETSVALSFHGFETPDSRIRGIRRKILREAILRCDDRWAVSSSAAAALVRELNLPRESFAVVPNGVDSIRFAPAADRSPIRCDLNLPEDQCVFLSVGNLKPVKGHDLLLRAWKHAASGLDRAILIILGRDYSDGSLARWAAEHLPGRDIRFVGERDDLPTWYQAADAFVLPSHWEGLPNALLEAAASGLPIIATRVGGNTDVIDDPANGRLVEPGDIQGLADAMTRLATDPQLRRRLGDAARRRAVDYFAIERTVASYAKRYRSLLRRLEMVPPAVSGATGCLQPVPGTEQSKGL